MSTRAAQIELFLSPLLDPTTGDVCGGYTAYFYAAGTSTAKAVWTESTKTNPYTSYALDSDGMALLYGDGVYKVVVKDLDGATVLERDTIKIQATTYSVSQKTAAYSATPDDDIILCNGTLTVTVGSAAYPSPSYFEHPLVIKNIGAGSVTVDPYGSVTIDADASVTVGPGDSIRIYPDSVSNVWRSDQTLRDVDGQELVLDEDGDTSITADTDDQIDIKVGGTDQVSFLDGVIEPTTDNDIDLGSSSKEFKDLYIDGTGYIDAIETDGITINSIAQGKDVTAALHTKIIEIGDWDMDSTETKTVAHGLTYSKIREVGVIIRNDDDNQNTDLRFLGQGGWYITSLTVNLTRTASVGFDTTGYNATSFNRGWVTIWYVD